MSRHLDLSKASKIQLPKEDKNNRGPPPLTLYKDESKLGKTSTDKSDSPKVNIKTQLGERKIKTVEIYVPLFWTGIPEALLNFATILNKIIRGQDLSMGLKNFGIQGTW